MSLFEQKSLLAKLMATENMIICQDNVPTASFDVLNRVLTVPVLDKNISKELYDLFMGHECGHALWTPVEGMKKAKAEKVNMSVLNVVEDSRIERKIKNKYPGIKSSFIKAYGELFERDFFSTEGKDLAEYNFIDRVNLHCKIGAQLALTFTEEERKLLEEVESTETFHDSVELTKKICEFMGKELEDTEQVEVKVLVVMPDENGEPQNSEESNSSEGEGEPKNAANNAQVEGSAGSQQEERGSDGDPEENEGGKTSSGSGAGRNLKNEEEIRSHTDDAYRKNEENLFSKDGTSYLYANIPVYDTSKIMDYKAMMKMMHTEGYTVNPADFTKYRKEASKVVSYLVKEFELRKNADQMKRASTAKTGELNMNRLYSYNFTEDIFKKITVTPQGQSHGLVMFLDWSGSMAKHFANTVKQLLNLVMFCKKVNIPFEVYSFIESTEHPYNYAPGYKQGDLSMCAFGLVNILSSRMNSIDFTYCAAALMKMSGANNSAGSWYRQNTPWFMRMSGTPLNEAVIAAMEIVPKFQQKNRLQIVNTVFLTDGEGAALHNVYGSETHKKYTHMVIRDPKTRNEEVFARNRHNTHTNMMMAQTDCFIRLLRKRTGSHVIGFFVGEAKDIANRAGHFYPKEFDGKLTSHTSDFLEKLKNEFRKNSSLIVDSTAFDDYYILRSNSLDTDDDDELVFKDNATTRGMVSAFSKYTGNKISSRVVLNRFIGLIS